ncbi:MAG: phosphotransferase [Deltaproteobacteria bacterium]|nr:phosphotransferase [Deltaproteobacteria bacterium]
MSAPAGLNQEQIRSILSLYHLDEPEVCREIDLGGSSIAYRVLVGGTWYVLRLAERRRTFDMIFEKEVLLHLGTHGFAVPQLVPNVAQGTFIPWSSRGRYVSLFTDSPGRALGMFEIRPKHVGALAELLAKLHTLTLNFNRERVAEQRAGERQAKLLSRLQRAVEKGRLPRRVARDVALLEAQVHRPSLAMDNGPKGGDAEPNALPNAVPNSAPNAVPGADGGRRVGVGGVKSDPKANRVTAAPPEQPRCVLHGDLSIPSVRFLQDEIVALVSFERAHTGPPLEDVARVLTQWCWVPTVEQKGGPAGSFHKTRVNALLAGYESVRPLSSVERAMLPEVLRRQAVHTVIERLVQFELKRKKGERYLDYRHAMQQLRAFLDGGAENLLAKSHIQSA